MRTPPRSRLKTSTPARPPRSSTRRMYSTRSPLAPDTAKRSGSPLAQNDRMGAGHCAASAAGYIAGSARPATASCFSASRSRW